MGDFFKIPKKKKKKKVINPEFYTVQKYVGKVKEEPTLNQMKTEIIYCQLISGGK